MRAQNSNVKKTDVGVHLIIAGIIVAFFFVAIGLPLGLWQLAEAYTCRARWAGTYETEFGYWSGCRVLVKGKLVPEANVREF